MLYLSNIYCRRLTAGVHQFAYTCIQEHAVWDNQQFWEAAFFHDVHRQIRRLYLPTKEESDCPFPLKEACIYPDKIFLLLYSNLKN
ncbi:hypothetical protein WUBG_07564 [Wuchereria bancrofti]|uniref:SBF1/SBF2 domain-containing protein n=1 Tax=Wuchereria bancrofti TaxID=6293 RepID=J9F2I3_WUCBA|nr:hypothetical protein WUBG_07564 [Wuchereria bancrofti]